MKELIVSIEGVSLVEFLGVNNSKLSILKRAFPRLRLISRGNKIKAIGNDEDMQLFAEKVDLMMDFLKKYGSLSEQNLESMVEGVAPTEIKVPKDKKSENNILFGPYGNVIKAKTANQRKLVKQSENNDLVFAIGPAGTGKTYTAVALAVRALKNKIVKKIVLTRPAVEAGESLGFLPGDLKDKVDPYLRPLYDALDDMLPMEKLNDFMNSRIIEIAPLAFMRGRTLDNSFLILDEAQNATRAQLKMFLTRLGPSAKCIITGDLTQIDLPRNHQSGLEHSLRVLDGIDGIGIVKLDRGDVIRHRLVRNIIEAYDKSAEAEKALEEEKRRARQAERQSKES